MIFTEKKITINNNECKIDSPVVLYRGDYNVEVRFTIISSPYKYSNKQETNVIEQTEASYGQLVIKTPNNNAPIFSEITATKRGAITFTITAEMIDEISEVGDYTFQIRLLDENKESRATIPEVKNGIEIREPIATENVSTTNEVDVAAVGYALTTAGTAEDAFDAQGNYNKTTWATGDRITAPKLNKIEAGIEGVNQKIASGGAVDLSGYVTKETGNASQITFADGQTFQAKLDAGTLKGEKGDQGPQGEIGPQGPQGAKGDKGDKGDTGQDGLTTAITVNGDIYNHIEGTITLPDYPTVPTKTSELENDSNFITMANLPSASENVTAEVMDARIGADEVTYSTIGSAIRTQFGNLYKILGVSQKELNFEWEVGSLSSGSEIANEKVLRTTNYLKFEEELKATPSTNYKVGYNKFSYDSSTNTYTYVESLSGTPSGFTISGDNLQYYYRFTFSDVSGSSMQVADAVNCKFTTQSYTVSFLTDKSELNGGQLKSTSVPMTALNLNVKGSYINVNELVWELGNINSNSGNLTMRSGRIRTRDFIEIKRGDRINLLTPEESSYNICLYDLSEVFVKSAENGFGKNEYISDDNYKMKIVVKYDDDRVIDASTFNAASVISIFNFVDLTPFVNLNKVDTVKKFPIINVRYEKVAIPQTINQDCCVVGDEIWMWRDNNGYVSINGDNFTKIREVSGSLSHGSAVDYIDNIMMICDTTNPYIYIYHNIKEKSTISESDSDCVKINLQKTDTNGNIVTFAPVMGSACFGENKYIMYYLDHDTNDRARNMVLYKILLGYGDNDLSDTTADKSSATNFGTFISNCNENTFNGTFQVLKSFTGELAGTDNRPQGMCYDGKLYVASGFNNLRCNVIEIDETNNKYYISHRLNFNITDYKNNSIKTESEAVFIHKNELYLGGAHLNYFCKTKIY